MPEPLATSSSGLANHPSPRYHTLKKHVLPFAFFAVLAAFYILIPRGLHLLSQWNQNTTPSWAVEQGDIDTILLHNGLVQHPHFSDALTWFWGPWVAGKDVPFYRPIPSLIFWCEWRVFGDHESRYSAVNLFIHLLVSLQFYFTTRSLLRYLKCHAEELALLLCSLAFFTGLYGLDPTRQVANDLIVFAWKNLPDALCALFSLISLSVYIRAVEKSSTKLTIGALFAYVCACASKEIATLLPFAFMLLEAGHFVAFSEAAILQRKRIGMWIGTMVVFQIMRLIFLNGVGFHYGSNGQWFARFISEIASPVVPLLLLRNWLPVLTAAVLLVAAGVGYCLRSRLSKPSAAAIYSLGWLAILLFLTSQLAPLAEAESDWKVRAFSVLILIVDQPPRLVIILCLFPLVLWQAFINKPLWVYFSYACIVCASLPNVASPGPLHREYLSGIGFSFLFGFGLSCLLLKMYTALIQAKLAFSSRSLKA